MAHFIHQMGYQNIGNGYEKEQSPFYNIADKYGKQPESRTHHMERPHYYRDQARTIENPWTLDMSKEEELGLMPAKWSVTSKMDDVRPNGKAMFDARFVNQPVPRFNAGMKMGWDPQGLANAKANKKVEHRGVGTRQPHAQ